MTSLRLFGNGRFFSLPDIVDLLDDQEDKALALAGVLGDLWRQGLVSRSDRFRYTVETVDGHGQQSLEVWANKFGRSHKHFSDGWYLLMTLRCPIEKTVPLFEGKRKGVQGENTPPVPSGFEGLAPEPGASSAPGPQCEKCTGTLPCIDRCKRELP